MSTHGCQRCGHISNCLSDLKKHLQRKNICKPTLEDLDVTILYDKCCERAGDQGKHKCDHCGKCFLYRQAKFNHLKICKKKISNMTLEEENIKLKELLLVEQNKNIINVGNTSIVNNNNTTNNQQNITINLNSFSRERIDHITPEFIKNCLKEMDMIRLLEQVHFDPEHPENHTVRMKNMNKNLLEYHQDGKWIIGNKDKVIEDMINCSGYRILKTFYRNNKEEIEEEIEEEEETPEEMIQEINDWLIKINKEDQKLFKDLKSNIFLVILNNKAMVCAR